jgi:outer membrane protein assembly factor BamB
MKRSLVILACVVALASPAMAENWPQWRGPRGDGTSTETALPVKWSKTENVAWRLALPGPGGASPVVWGDRVFVTSAEIEGAGLLLISADTKTGQELWRKTVSTGNKKINGDEGNFASPSPATDGKHVWAFMANGDLACYDFSGNEIWKLHVPERYGKLNIAFGMSSTPLLDGDRLYLQLIHGDGNKKTREAMVVALDKATGKEVWKQPRPSEATDECEHSYASPTLYRDDKRAYLLTHGADYVVAHHLEDGRELWRCGGLNLPTKYDRTLRFVASPVAVPGLIVVPSAKNGPVVALLPDGEGDVTAIEKVHVWTRPQNTPDVPTPLVHDGIVYLCRENGNLIAMDAKSGEELYQQATTRDRHRGSPVYGDGKLYLSARKGIVTVVKTGRTFEILSQNDMQESLSASPAISGGKLYFRTYDALYAIQSPK